MFTNQWANLPKKIQQTRGFSVWNQYRSKTNLLCYVKNYALVRLTCHIICVKAELDTEHCSLDG